MTRKMTKLSFPYALVSSTLGTVLVSMIAVWLAASCYAPVIAPDRTSAHHSHSTVPRHISCSACRRSLPAPTGPL